MAQKRTATENLEIAAEWFCGALAGYFMLRGVDAVKSRRAQVPESVRVVIDAPPVGPTPLAGTSGEVVDAEFVDDLDPASAPRRRAL